LLAFKPFLDSYQTPVSGVSAAPETTPLHQYLAHFGILAALVGAWLLLLLLRALRAFHFDRALRAADAAGYRRQLTLSYFTFAAAGLVLACGVLAELGHPFIAALLPVFAVVVYLALRELRLQRPDGGVRLFILTLVGLGLGLSIGVDLVTINGDIQRMNTVFKFYLHTWVVFGLAAAFAAWYLLFVVWLPALLQTRRSLPRVVARAGIAGLAALLAAAVLYPLAGTPSRLEDRFLELPRTLDGMAFMQQAVFHEANGEITLAHDYEGIQWLRANVQGTPPIVEGRSPLYRWGGRFSIYTGLPAVLGWDWHEVQQRGALRILVDERAREVDAFYADPDAEQALSFLARHEVAYVILGQVERFYYPTAGLAKLEAGLEGVLHPVYSNPGLVIYEVQTDSLARAVAAASP